MNAKHGYRIERDSMGEMVVPEHALWGAQTQRAIENFTISNYRFPRSFIRALGMVKYAAAKVNMGLDLLDKPMGTAILQAAGEVMEGMWDDQFVVDIFQTGSGTSTNMNANEVIARRAMIILESQTEITECETKDKKEKVVIHPNDHVNQGQSSNDVIPTCIHIAAVETIKNRLIPILSGLQHQLEKKAEEFDPILKLGRTHLQDATPMSLGQEFGGYASMIAHDLKKVKRTLDHLQELALGGTAVGTGAGTHPHFAHLTIEEINRITGCRFTEACNHFEAQGAKDAIVETSGTLKTLAVSLFKIGSDIKWMGAGPYGNLAELNIPAVQPGSSIMPGKINPVIIEALAQVAVQVIGNDSVVTLSGLSGNFELNTMMPVMAYNLLSSIALLSSGVQAFTVKCIMGITANEDRCKELMERSLAIAMALNPYIGYDRASELAKEAQERGMSLAQIVAEKNIMSEEKLNEILNAYFLIKKR